MLSSLVLFGSRARGDNRPNSDIDLLGITSSGAIEECRINGMSLYTYPIEHLLEKAGAGDLFLLHLVREGKTIHDTEEGFAKIRNSFKYKDSYADDILTASAVIWFLLDGHNSSDGYAIRRRLIWAIRTILIARLAECRTPAFSSASLSEFASDERIKTVIDERSSAHWEIMKSTAADTANKFGLTHHLIAWPSGTDEQLALLSKLGSVAVSTAKLFGHNSMGNSKIGRHAENYI